MEIFKIKDCFEKISYQIESLDKFDENIPSVHIDAIKANIIKLYDEVLAMERSQINASVNIPQENIVVENNISESEIEENIVVEDEIRESEVEENIVAEDEISESEIEENIVAEDEISESEIEENIVAEDEISESEIEENIVAEDEISESEIEENIDVEYKIEEKIEEKIDEVSDVENEPTLFGTFRQTVKTFNRNHDDLNSSYSSVATIADTIAVKHLKDIKQSISISDKFLFIGELFCGDVKDYTDSVLALNDCQSFEESMQIIEALQEKYSWEDETLAVSTFKNIVKRRFA
jgi:hypothetical protein